MPKIVTEEERLIGTVAIRVTRREEILLDKMRAKKGLKSIGELIRREMFKSKAA